MNRTRLARAIIVPTHTTRRRVDGSLALTVLAASSQLRAIIAHECAMRRRVGRSAASSRRHDLAGLGLLARPRATRRRVDGSYAPAPRPRRASHALSSRLERSMRRRDNESPARFAIRAGARRYCVKGKNLCGRLGRMNSLVFWFFYRISFTPTVLEMGLTRTRASCLKVKK